MVFEDTQDFVILKKIGYNVAALVGVMVGLIAFAMLIG